MWMAEIEMVPYSYRFYEVDDFCIDTSPTRLYDEFQQKVDYSGASPTCFKFLQGKSQ